MNTMTFGANKASDRKNLRILLTTLTLVPFFAAVTGEVTNENVKSAVEGLGLDGVFETASEVLRTQVSGTRGRPALEEKPIHTMLKAMKEALKFRDAEGKFQDAPALKLITKAARVASQELANLAARRQVFKPSKRIQGEKRLPIVQAGEGAKS